MTRPIAPIPELVSASGGVAARLTDVHLSLASKAGIVDILRGVSLDVAQGEAAAIVGPSGSGKTSLLMVLAGLERATRGRIVIAGRDITDLSEDDIARVRGESIGIVFQSFHLVPTMTALENVALPLEFSGHRDAFATAASFLDSVGLAHRHDHFPAQLSGGEQQRVALARALAPSPKLLLADEPTGNLDTATGEQIIELMFGLRRRVGTTLVLITHDIALAQRCDRIVRMHDGRIAEETARKVAAE